MKNKICLKKIIPFNFVSVLLIMMEFLFVAITMFFFVTGCNDGFGATSVIGMIIGIGWTVFIGIHLGRYLFTQKIELFDDYLMITYVKSFKNNLSSKPFNFAPIETKQIFYRELEKYGFFLKNSLRNGGRDNKNRRVMIFSSGGIPIPFVVPNDIEQTQNLFVFNCSKGEAITVDASLYSYRQKCTLFDFIKEQTGISGESSANPLKAILQVPIVRISLGGIYILFCAVISFLLRLLDTTLNPLHKEPYSSDYISCYTVGGFVAVISITASIATLLDKTKKYQSIQPIMFLVSISAVVLTVVCFVLSVWYDR